MATKLGAHAARLGAVRALRTKAGRLEQRKFAVEGRTMLREAAAAGWRPETVYVTEDGLASLGQDAAELDGCLFVVPERAMERLSDLETSPGILAVFPLALASLETLLATGRPAVVLAGISDPGNAGTILRSAEAFGIDSAIFASNGVEPHNPKVVRATMGALFRMQCAAAEAGELERAATTHGYAVVAASRAGTSLPTVRFTRKSLIAIGNERHGVAAWLGRWDIAVAIPQIGQGESLNAAVAGGIILYAFSQQFAAPPSAR